MRSKKQNTSHFYIKRQKSTSSSTIMKIKERRKKEMEKIKVLMIDDNQSLVDMVKEYFDNHNRIEVVLSCKDGEEGLNTIIDKSDQFDVVLLDLVMPNKDGLYVLE